jgi:uncharacterized membrane protein YfcA
LGDGPDVDHRCRAIDTFLVLFIGIGPKLALVPFVEITALLDAATKRRVERKMLVTAGTVALILMLLGELLRALLHFTIGSRSIAGGVILLVLAVWMVLGQGDGGQRTKGYDPVGLDRETGSVHGGGRRPDVAAFPDGLCVWGGGYCYAPGRGRQCEQRRVGAEASEPILTMA